MSEVFDKDGRFKPPKRISVVESSNTPYGTLEGDIGYQEPDEPDIDDSVKCCPECETPNQFGETCNRCRREIQEEGRTDLEID